MTMFRKLKILTPQHPPLGYDLGDKMKSTSNMFYIFHLWEDHKVWFKNLWNWLCNWNLMIFNRLAPPQGPRGQGQKHCDIYNAIHGSNSQTKFGWILEKIIFDPPTPTGTPMSHPWGTTKETEWKSHLICYISLICEKTNTIWFKNLWKWYFTFFAPPQGPRGRRPKKLCRWVIHTQNLVEFQKN